MIFWNKIGIFFILKMPERPKVCIIGCGPSGMSALYHFAKLPDEEMPDVVCYEKQKTWGGQWNPTWKTGNIGIGRGGGGGGQAPNNLSGGLGCLVGWLVWA